jgi:diguanylate cyclase (GGDEF)-like protein
MPFQAVESRVRPQRTVEDRRLMAWAVGACGFVAVFFYFLLPSTPDQDVEYVALGLLSSLAIAIGIRINRPADRRSWYLLLGANLCSTVGDGIENIGYGVIMNRAVPLPSVADLFYLSAYPLIFFGLIGVCRTRDDGAQRENFADAAIVALAAMAVSWHFVMGSDFRAALPAFGKVVVLAYPLMDIGLLFIMLHSLVFGSSRLTYHRILAAALSCTLLADSAYDYLVQHGAYAIGNIVDSGWLLNYVLMAVAALHPSMAEVPPPRVFDPTSRRRIPLLALAGFVPPAIVLVAGVIGASVDTPVMAATSIVVFGLVSARMSWLFRSIRSHTLQARADAAALAEALRARDRLAMDLRHQAYHDPLTGLANRTFLYHQVTQSLRDKEGRAGVVGLCLCDLDGFKLVNDSLGHRAGDELLTVVSRRLQSLVRSSDTVARLGGDEFAVLLNGVDSTGVAMRIADRIVAAMKEPVEVAGRQIALSMSVGMSFAESRKSTEQLLSEADVAMYEAKARGKSRWETFEASMQSKTLERLELANDFRGALERGEFQLLYQPQYSVADRRLEGFESLIRWQHPTRGLVGPDEFISLANETGFIIPLGRWVLERSCGMAAAWSAVAPELTIAVNLSGRQIGDASICDDIRTALALTGLPADRLVLEVTESSLLPDSEDTIKTVADLKAIGVRIALDDFGTGYSSLSYLRRLPLDVLKIDKSFVDPLVSGGSQDAALVATVVDFASLLGLRTVAEGVEEEAQLQQLRELGCSSVQGYLFSPAVDAQSALRLAASASESVSATEAGPGATGLPVPTE